MFAVSGPLWQLETLSSFKSSPLGVCYGRSPWEVGYWMLISSRCCPWDTFHFRPSRTGEGEWDCVVGAVGMAGKFSLALCCCDQGETLSGLGGTSQWTLLVISPGSCSLGPLISSPWLGSCTPRHLHPTAPSHVSSLGSYIPIAPVVQVPSLDIPVPSSYISNPKQRQHLPF